MYEYKYETIRIGGRLMFDNIACVHRATIDEQAAQGWRYVGYIPTEFTNNGGQRAIDLIFERPKE